MTEPKREFVGLRLLPDSIAAADAAAAAEGSDRSTVLRRWMAIGRDAEAGAQAPASPARSRPPDPGRAAARPTSAHGPAVIDADTHAKLQKGHR